MCGGEEGRGRASRELTTSLTYVYTVYIYGHES